jgi:hypothetical protein
MKLEVHGVSDDSGTVALELTVDGERVYHLQAAEESPAHIRTGIWLDKQAKRKLLQKVEV